MVPLLLHAVLAALAIAGLALCARSALITHLRAAALIVALVAIGVAVWSLLPARSVAEAAIEAAGPDPYCLQVADREKSYRATLSLFDLSRLELRSQSSWQYHGVLAVERPGGWRLYNWSNRGKAWQPIPATLPADMSPTPRCVPRPEYAERLGWWPDRARVEQPRDTFARVRGHSYLFPLVYRAKAHEGDPASIFFRAQGADFQPVDRRAGRQAANYWSVGVEFRSSDWMRALVRDRPTVDLSKTPAAPLAGPAAYVARDEQGQPRTVILCGAETERNPAPCQHWFYAEGAMWSFRQRPADLPQWEALEAALRRRVASFEAAGTTCETASC